ncbi:hypothetical protein QYE76_024131 [Lolium multiflorum]|uniref:Retrotransposon Copia-like N-terminal domain-containing protein n=1 Tax=Lolium multiflorum TaxID=4521 RepID=A0AAD8RFN1_LOLMU|nr:hypothetical protein QYE76_024131 [Lolium multiflorum]
MAPAVPPPTAVPINITATLSASIPIKLDQENFLLWKAQALPALIGNDLMAFVDGNNLAPPKFIPAETGSSTQVANPAFAAWRKTDQQILSGLLTSLTPPVLGHVQLLKTSAQVWEALDRTFASRSKARIVQLRTALVRPKKRDVTMSTYFQNTKKIADTMATIGNPLGDDDIVSYILAGLAEDHENFTTSITPPTMLHVVVAVAIKVVAAAEAVVVAMAAAMEEAVTMAASMTTVARTATVAATAAIKVATMEEATTAAVATTPGAMAQLREEEEEEDVDAVVASPRARSAVSMVMTPSAVILASTTPFSRKLPTGKPPTPTPPPTSMTMATTGCWTPVELITTSIAICMACMHPPTSIMMTSQRPMAIRNRSHLLLRTVHSAYWAGP